MCGAMKFGSIQWHLAAASTSAFCHAGKRKDIFRAKVVFMKHLGRMHRCALFWNSVFFLNYPYVLVWNWKLYNSFDPLSHYYVIKCFRTWVTIFCVTKNWQHIVLATTMLWAGVWCGLVWLGLLHNFSIFMSILPMLPLCLQAQQDSSLL